MCVCGGGKRDVSVTFEYQSIEVKTGRGIMQMQTMCSHFPAHTTNISPDKSEADKTRLEIQDWLQMSSIPNSTVIGKNEDGSDMTQDVDVLVWWRDVG